MRSRPPSTLLSTRAQRVTPLRAAAQNGRLDVVRVLVQHKGIDLEKPGNSQAAFGFESPLQVARRFGHDAIVEALLDAGAEDFLMPDLVPDGEEDEAAGDAAMMAALTMEWAAKE